MRFLSFLLIISLSHFTRGQNVFTAFENKLIDEDFSESSPHFSQKYTTSEINVVTNGAYKIKRISEDGNSVAFLKQENPISTYELKLSLEIEKSKNKQASGGLILHAQSETDGGIFIELKAKKMFRAYKLSGNQMRLLSGSPANDGWISSSYLTNKQNTIKVRVAKNYFDIYFNNSYTYTIYDTQFNNGNIGIFASSNTAILVDDFKLSVPVSELGLPLEQSSNTKSVNTDPAFEDVILIFKTKIDKQQAEIKDLKRDINKCKSMLTYDTTLLTKSTRLESENRVLNKTLDSTSFALRKANKRLKYLESMKQDIEQGSNGDLVLNLTSILTGIKRENQTLKITTEELAKSNAQLKKDNVVLLRELERLKYSPEIEE